MDERRRKDRRADIRVAPDSTDEFENDTCDSLPDAGQTIELNARLGQRDLKRDETWKIICDHLAKHEIKLDQAGSTSGFGRYHQKLSTIDPVVFLQDVYRSRFEIIDGPVEFIETNLLLACTEDWGSLSGTLPNGVGVYVFVQTVKQRVLKVGYTATTGFSERLKYHLLYARGACKEREVKPYYMSMQTIEQTGLPWTRGLIEDGLTCLCFSIANREPRFHKMIEAFLICGLNPILG